jgi:hypothetical protein
MNRLRQLNSEVSSGSILLWIVARRPSLKVIQAAVAGYAAARGVTVKKWFQGK